LDCSFGLFVVLCELCSFSSWSCGKKRDFSPSIKKQDSCQNFRQKGTKFSPMIQVQLIKIARFLKNTKERDEKKEKKEEKLVLYQ